MKDDKTIEFIRKSKEKHGDHYDYSKAKYINNKTKVEIICPEHGSFWQRADSHYNQGCKCPICSSGIPLTIKSFIERGSIIHNNFYKYNKIKELKSIHKRQKVIITCPIHGDFKQLPLSHLSGNGCNKCSIDKRKITLEEFIKRGRNIYGNIYNYNKIKYINNNTKVIITCNKHGDFKQYPDKFFNGHGCQKCGIERRSILFRKTNEEFINESLIVHDYKYIYEKSNYIDSNTKVIITCPIHGDFKQNPSNHVNGSGCPKCSSSKGEKIIRKYLKKKQVVFREQHSFDDCLNKLPLRFDFYLPNHNICIEFDGLQHYDKTNLFWSPALEKNDKIKNKYCENNNIKLIRIPYWDMKNIEKILNNFI